MKHGVIRARNWLLELLVNPGFFVLVSFTVSGMFTPGLLSAWRGLIEVNVILPWGLALALLRLYRASRSGVLRQDVMALAVLLAWLVVPFALRFGPTTANINTWQNFAVVFFGVYALTVEEDAKRFDRQLRVTTALFALVTFAYAGSLLYCAATVQWFRAPHEEFGFGVYRYAQLCFAQHYNATGMLALCCALMCLTGAVRARNMTGRLLYLAPSVMAMLVVVLAQSRTARYSLLIALAAGAYAMVATGRWHAKALIRHAAGLLAGAVVLVGGYAAASGLTDAALAYYAKVQAGERAQVTLVASAKAEEAKAEVQVKKARGVGDSTFTGRTDLWRNIFDMWKENPKYFLIGNGVGRTSRDILIGTPLENGGANMAHNAFIQFTMDHGFAALVLLGVFALMILRPLLRAFFVSPGMTGGRMMCLLVLACLATGMMESEPLSAMRPCNAVMFYALACAARAGEHVRGAKE